MDAQTAAHLATLSKRLEGVLKKVGFLERNVELAGDAPREFPWSTVSSVAAGAEVEITVTLPQSGAITGYSTSRATRGRLYDRAAKSAADASRPSGVKPNPATDHGLLLEWDGGTSAEDFALAPKAIITNFDGTASYKLRVKNLSAVSAVITGVFKVIF